MEPYHIVQTRVVLPNILKVSGSPMPTNWYTRLATMLVHGLYIAPSLSKYSSWPQTLGYVHSNWNRVDANIWMSRRLVLIPTSSVITLTFLGFFPDALKECRVIARVAGAVVPFEVRPFPDLTIQPLYLSNAAPPKSSYVASPVAMHVAEKATKFRELTLFKRTKTTYTPRPAPTFLVSDSLSSPKPSQPATRSRTANYGSYFHPTALCSSNPSVFDVGRPPRVWLDRWSIHSAPEGRRTRRL